VYRYGVPGGKFFAPSQADAEALVAQHPDRFAQGDFIYPRQGARSMANPEGTASGPDPVGVFVMLSPSDLSYRNGQKQLQEMQGEGAKGGLPTTISAREKHNGVSLVPWWSSTSLTRSGYKAVDPATKMGPGKMSYPHCQAFMYGCKPPPPLRVDSPSAKPTDFVVPYRRPLFSLERCCLAPPSTDTRPHAGRATSARKDCGWRVSL